MTYYHIRRKLCAWTFYQGHMQTTQDITIKNLDYQSWVFSSLNNIVNDQPDTLYVQYIPHHGYRWSKNRGLLKAIGRDYKIERYA